MYKYRNPTIGLMSLGEEENGLLEGTGVGTERNLENSFFFNLVSYRKVNNRIQCMLPNRKKIGAGNLDELARRYLPENLYNLLNEDNIEIRAGDVPFGWNQYIPGENKKDEITLNCIGELPHETAHAWFHRNLPEDVAKLYSSYIRNQEAENAYGLFSKAEELLKENTPVWLKEFNKLVNSSGTGLRLNKDKEIEYTNSTDERLAYFVGSVCAGLPLFLEEERALEFFESYFGRFNGKSVKEEYERRKGIVGKWKLWGKVKIKDPTDWYVPSQLLTYPGFILDLILDNSDISTEISERLNITPESAKKIEEKIKENSKYIDVVIAMTERFQSYSPIFERKLRRLSSDTETRYLRFFKLSSTEKMPKQQEQRPA